VNEEQEKIWIDGNRAAWGRILQLAVREIAPGPEQDVARLLLERQQLVAVLRDVCRDHGDNDWPDDLHLADVVQKHLLPYLDAKSDDEDGEHP
jgi:hypothetical protein